MLDPAVAGQILAVVFFFAILVVLLSGYIVAWTLGGLSMIFALVGWWLGAFDANLLQALSTRFFGVITNPVACGGRVRPCCRLPLSSKVILRIASSRIFVKARSMA